MIVWFLVSLLMTVHGVPAADIPRPFASEAECNVAGFLRGNEIAMSPELAHGVWTCLKTDFEQDDPIPPVPLPPDEEPPLRPKLNG